MKNLKNKGVKKNVTNPSLANFLIEELIKFG